MSNGFNNKCKGITVMQYPFLFLDSGLSRHEGEHRAVRFSKHCWAIRRHCPHQQILLDYHWQNQHFLPGGATEVARFPPLWKVTKTKIAFSQRWDSFQSRGAKDCYPGLRFVGSWNKRNGDWQNKSTMNVATFYSLKFFCFVLAIVLSLFFLSLQTIRWRRDLFLFVRYAPEKMFEWRSKLRDESSIFSHCRNLIGGRDSF